MATRALILIEGNTPGNSLLYVQAARRLGLHPMALSADPAQYDYIATEATEAIRVDTPCCTDERFSGRSGMA